MAATPLASEALVELNSAEVASGDGYSESSDPVAQTSWGQGEGLRGEVLAPVDLESLVDLIGNIEFKAEINTEDYIRYSNIDARGYFFDDDSIASGEDQQIGSQFNIHAHSHSGDNWGGQSIEQSDGSTFIEFREQTKDQWGKREFIRNLNNALSNNDYSSGYVFLQPENFNAEGIIGGSGAGLRRNNQNGNSLSELAESSPIVIDISSELADELSIITASSTIEFDRSDFSAFTSDYGDQGNITIKLADYIDGYGDLNTFALNSDVRLTLEIDSDAADKLRSFDNAWSNINLRSETNENGSSGYLSLNSNDHDKEEDEYYGDRDVTTYVESNDNGTTSFELTFDEWAIESAARNLAEGQSKETYSIEYLSAGFDTLAGNYYHSLNNDDLSQLTDSIQSITIDFSGYDPRDSNDGGDGDIGDISFSMNPASSIIDLSLITNDQQQLVDFEFDGELNHASFHTNYRLIDSDNTEVGNFNINGYANEYDPFGNEDGSTNIHINGYIHNNDVDLSEITARLSRIGVHGGTDNNWGDISLEFNYEPNDDSIDISRIYGWGWGEEYNSEDGSGPLPEFIDFNWEKFANLEIINFDGAALDQYSDVSINTYLSDGDDQIIDPPGDASISLNYNLYKLNEFVEDESGYSISSPLNQLAVLGDAVNKDSRFVLDINAESLENDYNIESTDVTIKFDPLLFGAIKASDIKIGGALPLSNAVHIDNDAGTIRLAAASLSDLGQGTGISGDESLASIALNFDESQIQYLEKNADGSLKISPLTFDISVNEQETIFSRDLTDESGLLNREILTLDQLGGSASISGQEVTLYEAQIVLEQQGDGLVLGTNRVIGADASYTNLVRKGDTLTTSTEWLNVGNIQANDLTYSEIDNENATLDLESASFSQVSVASGSFINGEFVEDARESTTFTADIEITGGAGNVVDLSDGIVAVHAEGTSQVFTNEGKGSSNLITFQGDLNYDGRVSMKDLAYLNAGAARQQEAVAGDLANDSNQDGVIDASVADDVDADFSGKIDLADLSVLDADWGKTLHTGDEDFVGSSEISWNELDSQGADTTWENDSFKDQNAVEAEADYVGSLDSPTSNGVIGADGNQSANDNDIQGTEFQDPIAL